MPVGRALDLMPPPLDVPAAQPSATDKGVSVSVDQMLLLGLQWRLDCDDVSKVVGGCKKRK